MRPILYPPGTTDFTNLGVGKLRDTISAEVYEARNGAFTLEIEYPVNGVYFDQLKEFSYIKAKPNDRDDYHTFLVYEVAKSTTTRSVIVKATTKTDEIGNTLVTMTTTGNPQSLLNAMKTKALDPISYNMYSDISASKKVDWVRRNPLNALVGESGSLVDLFGGELKRTDSTIFLYQRRGNDKVAKFTARRGLKGAKIVVSTASIVTRILPYIKVIGAFEEEDVTLTGSIVNSPLVNNYPVRPLVPVDFGMIDDSIDTLAKLNAKAATYFTSLYPEIDKPKVSIDLDLLSLQDTSEYAQFKAVEKIELCDTIDVYLPKYEVVRTVKVTELYYDSLREINTRIVAGDKTVSQIDAFKREYNGQVNSIKDHLSKVENTMMVKGDGTQIWSGPDTPPPDKVNINDIWWKKTGEDKWALLIWNGLIWEDMLSDEIFKEIDIKIDQAEKDIAQNIIDIDAALEKATQAELDAGFSKDLAEEAKSLGVTASSLAGEAKTNANTAMADALEAMRQVELNEGVVADANAEAVEARRLAGLAEGNAQEALTKANTAVTDSSTALTNATKAFNKSIKSTAIAYTTSTNGSTPPTTGWGTTVPSPSPDVYIWTRTTIVLNDNTPVVSYSVGKIGAKGDQGLKGDTGGQGIQGIPGVNAPTIKSVVQQFYLSTSKTSQTGGSWLATVPVWSSGKYYWVRVLTTYSNNATSTSTPVLDNALNDSLVTALEVKTANQNLSTTVTQHATLIESKANSSTVDSLTGRVSTAEGSISTIAGQVALKASTTDLNTLTGRVTTAEGTITAQAGQIALRATTATVNTLTGRVSTAEGTITAQGGQIALKASTEDVNALTGRVTTAEGSITTQAGQIASKVSQTDFNALNGRVGTAESTITQQAGEIALRVTTTTYNAGIGSKENTIAKASTAPAHLSGRLWLDTSVTPNILKRSTGSAWVKVTPTTPGEVGAYSAGAGSALAGRVTTAETSITSNTTAINLRATKTDLDAAKGRLTIAEGTIQVQAGQIALKASQTSVDSLTGRVGTAETNISANTTAINLRATKTDVNALTGRVTTAEGSITTQAGQIALRATTATVNALTGRVSTAETNITANSTAINLRATKTELTTAIDGIQVGGRNLILNSETRILDQLAGGANKEFGWLLLGQSYMDVAAGTDVVISFDLEMVVNTANPTLQVYNTNYPGPKNFTSKTLSFVKPVGGVIKERVFITTQIIDRGSPTRTDNYIEFYSMYGTSNFFKITKLKMERGNRATDWTPAPEDVNTSITTVQASLTVEAGKIIALTTKTNGHTTQIGTLQTGYNGLSSKVTALETGKVGTVAFSALEQNLSGFKTTVQNTYADKTTVNQLAGQWQTTTTLANGHTSQISSLGTAVNLRATKTEVDDKILADKTIKDTRTTNQLPTWYYTNYPKQKAYEFKTGSTIGLPGSAGTYASVVTEVPWTESSGGPIEQTATATDGVYTRRGTTTWSAWAKIADSRNIVSQINISPESILIASNKIQIKGDTYIENGVIKTAHIADLSVSGAKIANATISSAKIVSLDVSKLSGQTITGINYQNPFSFWYEGKNYSGTTVINHGGISQSASATDGTPASFVLTAGEVKTQIGNHITNVYPGRIRFTRGSGTESLLHYSASEGVLYTSSYVGAGLGAYRVRNGVEEFRSLLITETDWANYSAVVIRGNLKSQDINFTNGSFIYDNASKDLFVSAPRHLYLRTNGVSVIDLDPITSQIRTYLNIDMNYKNLWNVANITQTSDERLKTNITPTIKNGIEWTMKQRVVDYHWDGSNPLNRNKPTNKQFGIIAQNAGEFSIVNEQTGYLSVSTLDVINIGVKTDQEIIKKINVLDTLLNATDSNVIQLVANDSLYGLRLNNLESEVFRLKKRIEELEKIE